MVMALSLVLPAGTDRPLQVLITLLELIYMAIESDDEYDEGLPQDDMLRVAQAASTCLGVCGECG